jgi:hypothetical protein
MPHEFEFMEKGVIAAYQLGYQRGGEDTLEMLEELTDVYGINGRDFL